MTREFPSLRAFGRFIDGLRVRERISDEAARSAVASTLVGKIQRRLGHESLLMPELAASTQAQRIRQGFAPRTTLLKTGRLRASYESAVLGRRETGLGSALPEALSQEEGTSRIPARHPMARTASESDRELFALYVKLYRHFMHL